MGAATVFSGVDTLNKHDLFVNGNDGIEAEGRTAQLRTNVLLATTFVIGAGTTALGIFTFTQKAPAKGGAASASLAISPTGAALRVRY